MVKYNKHILTLIIFLLILTFSVPVYSQNISEVDFKLDHSVIITEHGFLAVNESIQIKNSEFSSVKLQPFELNYESISIDSISSITINGLDLDVLKSSVGNGTKLTFNPKLDYQIPSNDQITINVLFYISNQIDAVSTNYYSANLPLVPSMNKIIDEVSSNIFLPVNSEIINMPDSFFIDDEIPYKLKGSFQQVLNNVLNTKIVEFTLVPTNSFSILNFPNVTRTFIPSIDGSILVHDEIRVVNQGITQATQIKLLRLDNKNVNIEIVPTGNVPLINKLSTSLINEVFDLRHIYRASLSQGEEILFAIEYPISSNFATFKEGIISYSLPLSSPIDGVVESFTINIAPLSGVEILDGKSLTLLNITPYNADKYSFSTEIQIAWSSSTILPVATFLFLSSFIVLLSTKPKNYFNKNEKEIDNLDEMFVLFKEKIVDIENILQNYLTKKKISKSDVVETKNYFDSLKGKTAGKLGEIRTKINHTKPYLNDNLKELYDIDKEYNRSVLDIIKLYEQYSTCIIHENTFQKLLKKHEKRYKTAKNNILNKIDNVRNEI